MKTIFIIDDWIRKGEKLDLGEPPEPLASGGGGKGEEQQKPSSCSLARHQGAMRHDSGPHPEALVFQDGWPRMGKSVSPWGRES